MKIAIIDDYQDAFRNTAAAKQLAGHELLVYTDTEKDPAKLAARLQDAEVLVLTQQRSKLPRAVIDKLPKLKLISQTGRNAYHIDIEACTERGIVISAGGAGNPNPTAELAWGLILASLRRIPQEVQRLKSGQWQNSVGTGLFGKTLGIYAYGRIGSLVAQVGKAFGMKVVCWGREGSTGKAKAAGYDIAASREAFFAEADVISLHLPLNDGTRGIVTAEDLALMKTTALIVNTSRAPIIAKDALVNALKAGRPGRAGIDVYEEEPVMNASHPLIAMDNVVCTPHLGYVEEATYEAYYGTAVKQILAFIAGKPINVANEDVLKK